MSKCALIFALNCITVNAFETDQLPVSDEIAKTFPKLNSGCYIVVNIDTNIVVTSLNAEELIDTGTFRDVYDVPQSASLYEMATKFTDGRIFFQSEMSGNGVAIQYTNKHGANFIILVYGESTKENAITDLERIQAWLEQFYIYDIKQPEKRLYIPVIYGEQSITKFNIATTQPILLSSQGSKKIEKVLRYRTILRAPVNANDEIGYILYYTDLFKNPIQKTIKAEYNIKKSSWFQCICDSVKYLIFGSAVFK